MRSVAKKLIDMGSPIRSNQTLAWSKDSKPGADNKNWATQPDTYYMSLHDLPDPSTLFNCCTKLQNSTQLPM
jgi:hypothetical protein